MVKAKKRTTRRSKATGAAGYGSPVANAEAARKQKPRTRCIHPALNKTDTPGRRKP